MMSEPLVILSIDRVGAPEHRLLEEAVEERFTKAAIPVLRVPSLCHLAEDDPLWERVAARLQPRTAVLSWIHPRPAEWIARRHGWFRDARNPRCLDLGVFRDADDCFTQVTADFPTTVNDAAPVVAEDWTTDTDERWYPVIDYSRCTDCRQCLQFCLFGVYTLDEEGKVRATAPDQCKPGCPACSRICPASAIMFPLCDADKAIAGAPGCFVTPDSAVKSVYYARTGKPCPLCGQTYRPALKNTQEERPVCPECGMIPASADHEEDPGSDDLDDLIDALENLR